MQAKRNGHDRLSRTVHLNQALRDADGKTVAAAQRVLKAQGSRGSRIRSVVPFLGPAFIASVAYVDPGNFATNIQGGAQFGYTLLWVIVASNLMAMLIQTLSAKLGIATGKNLAECCREHFPRPVVYPMWCLMELVAMATDLAEFLGAALGFQLLLGIPLLAGGLLTAVITFLILGLERYGFRPLEGVITVFVGIIAIAYIIEIILGKPQWNLVMYHAVVPHFSGTTSLFLAAGILGATVMPHATFLHSALTQGRIMTVNPAELKRLFRFEIVDVSLAMGLAGFVNMAMLIMAAATFYQHGLTGVGTLQEAHLTLRPLLGAAAGWIFALSLLTSGLSSSTVGTSAGQVIMQGFLQKHVPVWIRRIVTMLPSLVVIALGLDPTNTLVLSQVVLSFGLPFALVPLVLFTSSKRIMGALVNRRPTAAAAGLCTFLIVALNAYLLYQTMKGA
jgi:manganese transport protein